MKEKRIEFGDLPKYTGWPSRLLGLDDFSHRAKTPEEIQREFNAEKWRSVLDWIEASPSLTYTDIDDRRFRETGEVPFFDGSGFHLIGADCAHRRHLELYESVISQELAEATALVELGAGYGSVILGLAMRMKLKEKGLPLYAAEYTPNGMAAMKVLARNSGLHVSVGRCDFGQSFLEDIGIPHGAVVFTAYAATYIPTLSADFIHFFARLGCGAVFHFEPCYEHYPAESLHGLMCQRYIQLNDYNRNLVSLLHAHHEAGEIDLFLERKTVMGSNPLLPISVLGWKPV